MAVPAETDAVAPTLVKSAPATVVERDTVVNDVPLRLRTPVNALPELVVGIPDSTDEHLVLVLQAADIRADNHGIVGAFVCKGELLSRGVAKRGFCAIIGRSMQLGMAESTPLFEEAINKEGYFFRQYPLVESGRMVENKPKGKALRHALCELDGRVVTVSSLDKESFHDFAQLLIGHYLLAVETLFKQVVCGLEFLKFLEIIHILFHSFRVLIVRHRFELLLYAEQPAGNSRGGNTHYRCNLIITHTLQPQKD